MDGVLLWEGFSRLDGEHVMAIATGLRRASENVKTGGMIQTYILRADVDPVTAIKHGADASICGACPHRGANGKGRTCYVNVGQGPLAVYRAHSRGAGYPMIEPHQWSALFSGRTIRFGTYGDPLAVPVSVWRMISMNASGWTGYTHQWRQPWAADYKNLVMASVDSPSEAAEARLMGWRTFRVSSPGDLRKLGGEVLCPASAEAGKKLTCEKCLACSGANGRKGSIMIPAHGGLSVMANFRRKIA